MRGILDHWGAQSAFVSNYYLLCEDSLVSRLFHTKLISLWTCFMLKKKLHVSFLLAKQKFKVTIFYWMSHLFWDMFLLHCLKTWRHYYPQIKHRSHKYIILCIVPRVHNMSLLYYELLVNYTFIWCLWQLLWTITCWHLYD